MAFRCLPEYIVEDIVDYLHFATQTSPDKFELAGKTELLVFILTFLTSTWYIKNPFLKSKINDVSYMRYTPISNANSPRPSCRSSSCRSGGMAEKNTVCSATC
jgi:hypothetical protein